MTTESGDGATGNVRSPATDIGPSQSPTTVLKETGTRIRRDPVLLVPFAIAGVLVGLADWLRVWDPIPAATPASVGGTIGVDFSIFPKGTARTVRHVGALIDLETPYLLGALGLELLVVLAIGLAGWFTIDRVLGSEQGRRSLGRYLLALLVLLVPLRLLGARSLEFGSVLLGVLALLVFALVAVWLFLFPGLLAAGLRLSAALGESVRQSRGIQGTLLVLVVVFGLASWGLAQLPVVGGASSTAVVGVAHAVTLGVLLRRTGGAAPTRAGERS